MFVYTALCRNNIFTTVDSVSRHSVWSFGSSVARSEALGLCFECTMCYLPPVLYLSSSLQAVVERVNSRAIDKWGQEERTLGCISLSCLEFNINTGWKDSSPLHHLNAAQRHSGISIRQERQWKKKEGKRKRECKCTRERVDCRDESVSNKTQNFISLRQLPWRSPRDGKWAGFRSHPIKH